MMALSGRYAAADPAGGKPLSGAWHTTDKERDPAAPLASHP
jgi:hypothetical protein